MPWPVVRLPVRCHVSLLFCSMFVVSPSAGWCVVSQHLWSLSRIFDVAWCRSAILCPQGSSIIELARFYCSRLIRTYSVVPSFEASPYHSPLFNASDHPWFFGSSLSSSMPEITSGFLGSLFSVMFLGLSSGCLLFVFSLLGSMFSFQFEGPSIC